MFDAAGVTLYIGCCIQLCDSCDTPFDPDDLLSTPNGDKVCDFCYAENYYHCDVCGEPALWAETVNVAELDGSLSTVCPDCAAECSQCGNPIHQEMDTEGLCVTCYHAQQEMEYANA